MKVRITISDLTNAWHSLSPYTNVLNNDNYIIVEAEPVEEESHGCEHKAFNIVACRQCVQCKKHLGEIGLRPIYLDKTKEGDFKFKETEPQTVLMSPALIMALKNLEETLKVIINLCESQN